MMARDAKMERQILFGSRAFNRKMYVMNFYGKLYVRISIEKYMGEDSIDKCRGTPLRNNFSER